MTAAVADMEESCILLLRTFQHTFLILLPAAAAILCAIKRGLRDGPLSGLVGVAALGATGYAAFWCWWLSPVAGFVLSCLLPVACVFYCAVTWKKLSLIERKSVLEIRRPFLLLIATTLLVLSVGFLYGGVRDPLSTAARRFSHELPPDNRLPLIFADQIRSARLLKPMAGEWSSSDRPPLQTGILLAEFPIGIGPKTLASMIIGVFLQTLSAFVLCLFLQALSMDGRLIALTLAAVIFPGFFFVNSFFVWPKLLAAAYLLGFAAMLLAEPLRASIRQHDSAAVLAGALLAFGLLSHGSSFFALPGFLPLLVFLRKKIARRSILIIALSATALYLPWLLYQKCIDPPGDRLIRYHLAGERTIDTRPLAQAVMENYHSLTWHQVAEIRKENLTMVFDDQRPFWKAAGALAASPFRIAKANVQPAFLIVQQLRLSQFFHFATALGLLMPGPLFLFAGGGGRYRSETWKASAVLLAYTLTTLLMWCAIMFVPSSTSLHQGTYLTILLALAGSVMAVWVVSPRLAGFLVAIQVAFTTVVYGAYGPSQVAGASQSRETINYSMLAVALFSCGLVMMQLRRLARFHCELGRTRYQE